MRERTKGSASRGLSVFLRVFELACGAIVLGLLGRAFYLIDNAGVYDPNARLVYSAVIAAMTIIHAIFFMPPLGYNFWFFPIDFFFFVAWLVVFCVLVTLTGSNTCDADWYYNYWGYYWGRWYYVAPPGIDVNWTGCSAWRTVLAFSFIAIILYLLSFFLGLYWVFEHGKIKDRRPSSMRLFKKERWSRRKAGTAPPTGGVVERGAPPTAAGGVAPAPAATPATGTTATTRDATTNV